MTIKSATMLVFHNTQSNPQTKRKKNTDKPSPGPKTTRFQQPVLESLAFCRDGKIFSQDPPISFHHFLQGFFAPVTIIERTLPFLITLLPYSRPKIEGTTSHVYGKRQTANGKRKFAARDQVSHLLVVHCFLYLHKYVALGCVSSLKSDIGLKIRIWILVKKRTLRFFDEDDYEYKIFSILSIAQAWTSVILAGKRDRRRHSTTSFSEEVVVAGTSYQM